MQGLFVKYEAGARRQLSLALHKDWKQGAIASLSLSYRERKEIILVTNTQLIG